MGPRRRLLLDSKPVAIMAENAPTRTPEEIAKEYDLLPKLVTHLDRHLIFPLLQFLEGQDEEEPSEDVTRTKYELLKKTNMTDYVASLYCELEGLEDAPAEFATKRQEVLDRLDKYSEESEKINVLYDFGNFQYSCGNYQAAAELLYQFRILSTDNDKVAAATWGKLASEILTTNWEVA